jgi:hypothetical protein
VFGANPLEMRFGNRVTLHGTSPMSRPTVRCLQPSTVPCRA